MSWSVRSSSAYAVGAASASGPSDSPLADSPLPGSGSSPATNRSTSSTRSDAPSQWNSTTSSPVLVMLTKLSTPNGVARISTVSLLAGGLRTENAGSNPNALPNSPGLMQMTTTSSGPIVAAGNRTTKSLNVSGTSTVSATTAGSCQYSAVSAR